jgi:cytochrome oxidase assembly protein ShyY1
VWEFARRPRWIASHLLVLVVIGTMVSLGLWQLRRLDEKTKLNETIKERANTPVVEVGSLIEAGQTPAAAKEASQWRRVSASGTYRTADELVVANRIKDGDPGYWVLTPLVLDDGSTLVVARGFVYRFELEHNGLAGVAAPDGRVTIEGVLQASPSGGRFGEERTAQGPIPGISQADVSALAKRWGTALLPLWLRLDAGPGAPAEGTALVTIPPPPLSRGPHLSYAVQWFIFSAIAFFGYPMILLHRARTGSLSRDDPGHD